MLLFLTAVDARTGVSRDVTIDAEDDTTVGDLAIAVFDGDGQQQSADPDHNAVRLLSSAPSVASGPSLRSPGLFLRGRRVPDDAPLKSSPIRHGAVVGIGGPVDDPGIEPTGLLDLRCTGGYGAGLVHRLNAGSYLLGVEQSALPLVPDSPEIAVYIEVDVRGRATVRDRKSVV